MCDGKNCGGGSVKGWLVAGAAVPVIYAVKYAVEVVSDVCSLRGLGYSIGIASADGLAHPGAVRVVTLVALLELAAGVSALADVSATGGRGSALSTWLHAHLSLGARCWAGLVWLAETVGAMRGRSITDVGLPPVGPDAAPLALVEGDEDDFAAEAA